MKEGPRFGLLGSDAFLNHASVSPPCRAARRAVHEAADAIAADDGFAVASAQTSLKAREAFAKAVGSSTDRVMCFPNTSAAVSGFAYGLDWQRGDKVLVSRNEFVSNYLPWKMQAGKGVDVQHLPTRDEHVDPGVLERLIDDDVRVVAVSAVHWATGARQDLRALADIAHAHGAFLVVDAAQSLGAVQHDRARDGYDLLATNTYKWLCSYNGTAFADYSPAALEALSPTSFGWLAIEGDPEPAVDEGGEPDFRLSGGVERFLGGAPSALSNLSAVAALEEFRSVGWENAETGAVRNAARVMEIADGLGIPVVTPRGRGRHAGLVALRVPHAARLVPGLRARGVRLGERGGFLRVSPHFYTTSADLDRFAEALATILAEA